MKKYFLALMALQLLSACNVGDTQITETQEILVQNEIEEAFNELAEAAKLLDHEHYLSFFDEKSFSVLNANGTTLSTFEAFKNSYLPQLEFIKGYNYLEFDPVNINVIDTRSAILVNEYSAEVILKSGEVIQASGAGVQFWSKRTGEWKLVHVSDAVKQ
ncbi:nuclear transport factor 2 family protein [Hellea sp.]|nr:nuclear transport factor 2 family protein [Hellea sp.]